MGMFRCRLASLGWETYTGSMGIGTMFDNGVSVEPMNRHGIARIGSSLTLLNDETGEQVGPASQLVGMYEITMPVVTPVATQEQVDQQEETTRAMLESEEAAQRDADAAALEEAQRKALEEVEQGVVYTRAELEAIAGNDGIGALREIAKPLGVKGRAIGELVTEILEAQAKLAAS